ncbi:MAG: rhomboid family intramembrane serine protease [Flavobacteriaceae bacterium]|nr:rhomboid family intramembrane serine protease [Flavobacteriaceae bacterium]
MKNFNQDIRFKLSRLNVFEKIIVVNFIIYVFTSTILRFQGFGMGLEWLSLSKSASKVLLMPWTLITYGFMHYSFSHLLFNMLVLYFFGRSFSNLFKADLCLKVYLLGIFSGGLAFVFIYNLFPSGILNTVGPLVGASAGVRAVIVFLCAYLPNKEVRFFTFQFPLKYIGIALVVLDIPGLFSQNSGGTIAHFGGYILGYYYAVQFHKGIDIGEFIIKIKRFFSFSSSNLKTVYKNNKKKDNSLAGKKKKEFDSFTHQKQIDLILDKISKSGYESLTQLEKDFLFRAGK